MTDDGWEAFAESWLIISSPAANDAMPRAIYLSDPNDADSFMMLSESETPTHAEQLRTEVLPIGLGCFARAAAAKERSRIVEMLRHEAKNARSFLGRVPEAALNDFASALEEDDEEGK